MENKCKCSNGLEYENCSQKCGRQEAEQEEELKFVHCHTDGLTKEQINSLSEMCKLAYKQSKEPNFKGLFKESRPKKQMD